MSDHVTKCCQEIVSKQYSQVNLLSDPKFKAFMDEFLEHVKSTSSLPFSEQRKLGTQFTLSHTKCEETVHRIENLKVLSTDNYPIPVRIYIPNQSKNLPVLMYFHGGGWVYGNIDDADAVCRRLANYLGCIIASVDYRLAPEYPFPKPLEDCYEATEWMAKNATKFGGNSKQLMVSGESAGGNLAAAVAIMSRDKQGPKLSAQLLIYPAITSTIKDAIYDQCPDRYFMTKDVMKFFWNMYVQSEEDRKNPYASLECGNDFKDLPPALIVVAEYDPMRDEAEKYGEKLRRAGVPVVIKCFPELIHGFLYIALYEEQQKVKWTKQMGQTFHELLLK